MTYEFTDTAAAIAFEDTMANERVYTGAVSFYRPTNRTGRVVWVRTFARTDFRHVDEEAARLGGVEHVGAPGEN